MYQVEIVADSRHPNHLHRLTTMEVVLPRFLLAELNTHRVFSRNSESSRAKPPERRLEEMERDLFVPMFGSRVKGMGQGKLAASDELTASIQWRGAARQARSAALGLLRCGVDKSHVNRLLEPFLWQKVLITSDSWQNFFKLRCASDAQPEFQHVACMMRDALKASRPKQLGYDDWHLPYVRPGESKDGRLLSVGRCAAISYDAIDSDEDPSRSIGRANRLAKAGHWSPFEHQAQPAMSYAWCGNFAGPWVQLRKTYDA